MGASVPGSPSSCPKQWAEPQDTARLTDQPPNGRGQRGIKKQGWEAGQGNRKQCGQDPWAGLIPNRNVFKWGLNGPRGSGGRDNHRKSITARETGPRWQHQGLEPVGGCLEGCTVPQMLGQGTAGQVLSPCLPPSPPSFPHSVCLAPRVTLTGTLVPIPPGTGLRLTQRVTCS